MTRRPPTSPLFPSTPLSRSLVQREDPAAFRADVHHARHHGRARLKGRGGLAADHRRLPVPHLVRRGRVRRRERPRVAHRAVLRAVLLLRPIQVDRAGRSCCARPAAPTPSPPPPPPPPPPP